MASIILLDIIIISILRAAHNSWIIIYILNLFKVIIILGFLNYLIRSRIALRYIYTILHS